MKYTSDVVIVGAGASGLMAMVGVRENNKDLSITILDGNAKIGNKMYITGKGRCNVCNNSNTQNIVENIMTNKKFAYSMLNQFSSQDVMDFFNTHSCKLKTERGNRVFPITDKSSDVIKVFGNYIKNNNINLQLNSLVVSIEKIGNYFTTMTENDVFVSKYVIVATGGVSYPATGSKGDGFKFAKNFNHSVTKLKPALCGFKANVCTELQGLTLNNIGLSISVNNKILFQEIGDITFYKNVIAGPLCLTASSLLNNYTNFELNIDLKPYVEKKEFSARFYKLLNENPNNTIMQFLLNFMPSKLANYFVKQYKIGKDVKVNNIENFVFKEIISKIRKFSFKSIGLDDIECAIITSGGINVKEISPNNLESKIINNLFFVGEVLDIDALTGGYNMQIAFSSGYCAGKSVAERELM